MRADKGRENNSDSECVNDAAGWFSPRLAFDSQIQGTRRQKCLHAARSNTCERLIYGFHPKHPSHINDKIVVAHAADFDRIRCILFADHAFLLPVICACGFA